MLGTCVPALSARITSLALSPTYDFKQGLLSGGIQWLPAAEERGLRLAFIPWPNLNVRITPFRQEAGFKHF